MLTVGVYVSDCIDTGGKVFVVALFFGKGNVLFAEGGEGAGKVCVLDGVGAFYFISRVGIGVVGRVWGRGCGSCGDGGGSLRGGGYGCRVSRVGDCVLSGDDGAVFEDGGDVVGEVCADGG